MATPPPGSYNAQVIAKLKAQAAAAAAAVPNPGTATPASSPAPNIDPAVMAASQFAPQYALLDQMAKQAQNNYGTAGKNTQSMWDALASSMSGHEGAIKKDYAQAGSDIGKAYNDALASTNQGFSQSRNEIADIAARLGVQEAVPSALSQGSEQQSRLVALLNAAGANYKGLNTSLGNNEVQYNRQQADTAHQAGINAKTDFNMKLQQALSDLGNKRLDVMGQEQSARNSYEMSLSKMAQDAQLAREKIAATAGGNDAARAQAMVAAARLQLDQDKFAASRNTPANTKNMSPYELVANLASKLYSNPQAQTNATNAITDTLQRGYHGDRNWANVGEFIDAVLARNTGATDYRQLQQMAMEFYTRLAGGADKPYRS